MENDITIGTAVLKEAEFMRNEILAIGTSTRNVFIGAIAFIGALLTVMANFLTKDGGSEIVTLLIKTNCRCRQFRL